MDIIYLHEQVHDRIVNGDNTERTTDAVMWLVRAALADKDRTLNTLREDLDHAERAVRRLEAENTRLKKERP
jgi:hypothetical protein